MKQDKSPPTAGDIVESHEADGRSDDGPARSSDADRIAGRYEHDATDAPAEQAAPPAEPRPSRRERAGEAARTVGRGASWARTKIGQVVWLVAVLCAVVLGAGALLVALEANPENSLVSWVLDRAGQLDGPFYDIFTFSGGDAAKKQVLVGWALAAVAYLVAGRVLDRVIRP